MSEEEEASDHDDVVDLVVVGFRSSDSYNIKGKQSSREGLRRNITEIATQASQKQI